jgi:hypothetical protein
MPEVKPLKVKDPKVKQPPYPLRSLPCNSLHIGPSGSGKSVALIRTLIDRDKLGGCFDAYHVFSPNCWVDSQYKVLGRYIEDHTGQKLEDCFHDTWDPGAIEQLIADQKKVNSYLKKKKAERLLSVHITIDDFGENMNVVKSNHSILNTLFVKGRHYQISTALLLQRFRLASPTIRYNAHALYVHKLSNTADRKALSEEFGELLGDESVFTELLHRATAEKFGFLYVTLGSEPKFFSSYKSEFRLKENRSEEK